MDLRPIKTAADYQNALHKIELLFDAAPETAEADRLDVLSTLVDAYEKVHVPIELPVAHFKLLPSNSLGSIIRIL